MAGKNYSYWHCQRLRPLLQRSSRFLIVRIFCCVIANRLSEMRQKAKLYLQVDKDKFIRYILQKIYLKVIYALHKNATKIWVDILVVHNCHCD